VKNLGAMGDAGCATGRKDLMDRVRMFRDHGRVGRYNIVELGYNARIDNMQSNIVMAKLPRLSGWIQRKREIVAYYNQQLKDVVKTIHLDPRVGQGHYVYVIQTDRRDALRQHLESRGIGTNIHYATTTHQQPAFRPWARPCPVAERTVQEILSLPCWYSMTQQQIDHVVASVQEFFS
jgi:dTDP-4-amino-4,6-dideoxygalactose transaminase